MDSSARIAHHIIEASMPAAVPERIQVKPPKKGLCDWVVDALFHLLYFLSPVLGLLALIVLCLPYVLGKKFVKDASKGERFDLGLA